MTKWWSSGEPQNFEILEDTGEIIGVDWHNNNRPTYVEIIHNFDDFGDLGYELFAHKIAITGQMSVAWDRLSGKLHRERVSSGSWKEVSPGKWRNEEEGIITRWSERNEEESQKWNSREDICLALDDSSEGFREALFTSLERLTERIEILHKGEIEFHSKIFTDFEVLVFFCCNTFPNDPLWAEKSADLGVRILSAEHPIHPIEGNQISRDTSGSRILSKFYDEAYCMFRKNVLKLCHKIIPDGELAALIGLEESELEPFMHRADEWSMFKKGRAKIGNEVRAILGVNSTCTICGKFLPNPRHTHCRKHYLEIEN